MGRKIQTEINMEIRTEGADVRMSYEGFPDRMYSKITVSSRRRLATLLDSMITNKTKVTLRNSGPSCRLESE